jgi:hypothetical protein
MSLDQRSVPHLPFGFGALFPAFLTYRGGLDFAVIDLMRPLFDNSGPVPRGDGGARPVQAARRGAAQDSHRVRAYAPVLIEHRPAGRGWHLFQARIPSLQAKQDELGRVVPAAAELEAGAFTLLKTPAAINTAVADITHNMANYSTKKNTVPNR